MLADFRGVDVKLLGKFRQRSGRNYVIEGSFFSGDSDEIGGIVEYKAEGNLRVLGAFGAKARP